MAIQCSLINRDTYISIPQLTLAGVCTIVMWTKGTLTAEGLLGWGTNAQKIVRNTSNSIFCRPVDGDTSSFSHSGTWLSGWNMFVIKRDSSNVWYTSLNGSSFTTQSTISGNSIWDRLGWAAFQDNTRDPYCEYCFWDGADLTEAEVSALWSGTKPNMIKTTSIARYYPLYKNVSTQPDLSGNAQNGSLVEQAGGDMSDADHAFMKQYAPSPKYRPILVSGGGGGGTPRFFVPAIIG